MSSSQTTPGDLCLALARLIRTHGRDAVRNDADPAGDGHISSEFLRGNKRRLLRPRRGRIDRGELRETQKRNREVVVS